MSDTLTMPLTGRCYCGEVEISSSKPPLSVVLCHCESCRRANSAPVAAIVALDDHAVQFKENEGKSFSKDGTATRYFCGTCGTSTAARYDYLPDQVYVPVSLFDQADLMPADMHSHEVECLSWLKIEDDTTRYATTSRDALRQRSGDEKELQT